MRWFEQRWVRGAALLAVIVAGVLLVGRPAEDGPPLDPDSSGPLGTAALVALLAELGAEVDIDNAAPAAGDEVALVLADDLDDAGRAELEAWVRSGGTLVVADPASTLHPFPPDPTAGLSLVDVPVDRSCAIPALASVGEVEAPAGSVVYELVPGASGCYRVGDLAYLAAVAEGDGVVVAVGGAGLFTNQAIGDADNAVLAAALLVPRPGTDVAFLRPPVPGSGGEGLADLVGDNVKAALWQLGLAFVVYALWRARRLGRPVAERQPVELEASELVVAVGRLLQQARHHDEAARLVGDGLRRRLAERLGLGPEATAEQVAEVAAGHSGIPTERILAAMAPPPLRSAEALVAHGVRAEAIHQEVLHV